MYPKYLGTGNKFLRNSSSLVEATASFFSDKNLLKYFQIEDNYTFENNFFNKLKFPNEFIWFVAKSRRSDLQAETFHYHSKSGNASGEHSF